MRRVHQFIKKFNGLRLTSNFSQVGPDFPLALNQEKMQSMVMHFGC
jgi:hypothetical protein